MLHFNFHQINIVICYLECYKCSLILIRRKKMIKTSTTTYERLIEKFARYSETFFISRCTAAMKLASYHIHYPPLSPSPFVPSSRFIFPRLVLPFVETVDYIIESGERGRVSMHNADASRANAPVPCPSLSLSRPQKPLLLSHPREKYTNAAHKIRVFQCRARECYLADAAEDQCLKFGLFLSILHSFALFSHPCALVHLTRSLSTSFSLFPRPCSPPWMLVYLSPSFPAHSARPFSSFSLVELS